jgi:hypothetical protein
MTTTAFLEFVAVSDAKGHTCQDVKGRWWDVVFMFRRTKRTISPLEARWSVMVRDPDGRGSTQRAEVCKRPSDDGERGMRANL